MRIIILCIDIITPQPLTLSLRNHTELRTLADVRRPYLFGFLALLYYLVVSSDISEQKNLGF